MGTISGSVTGMKRLTGTLSPTGRLSGVLSLPEISYPYRGEYEITPGEETQVIAIANLKATQDIIINAIPSNYGLVTWDGSILTIS